jgi:hypothetical protein
MKKVFKKYFLSFWFFAIVLVFCSGFATICLYRTYLGVEFSRNPSDWSVFGSYFGGVVGPLVSFVTLLAVLRTVYLQKELLGVQRSEFDSLMRLQLNTFASQERQVKNAMAIADREHMERSRGACLQMLDRQLLHTENKLTRLNSVFDTVISLRSSNPDEVVELVSSIKTYTDACIQLTEIFQKISISVSTDEYESPEALHEFFRSEMSKAYEQTAVAEDAQS